MADEAEPGKRSTPSLKEGRFFSASVDESQLFTLSGYLGSIVAVFREDEGLGLVFAEDLKPVIAQLTDKEIAGPFAQISLNTRSEPSAFAKAAQALAKKGIGVNAFSAYFHDHLFVPYERKDDAMGVLAGL